MTTCVPADWICAAGDAVGNAAADQFAKFAIDFYKGWMQAQQDFLTSWLSANPELSSRYGSIPWLQSLLTQFSIFFAIGGILTTAIYTVLAQRGDRVQALGISMFRMLLITSLGTGLFTTLSVAMDVLAQWILKQAGVSVTAGFNKALLASTAPGLVLIMAVIGILGVLIQWGIMLVRSAILPLLLGMWGPATAAATIKNWESAFTKITAWLIAFLLYMPVAAIIYAFGNRMSQGADGLSGMISGMILVVLAVLALPALMRLIVPAAGALGNAIGGAISLGVVAAVGAAAVASGAAVVSAGGSTVATGASATTASGATPSAPPSPGPSPSALPVGNSESDTPTGGGAPGGVGATAVENGSSSGAAGSRMADVMGQHAAQNMPSGSTQVVEDTIGG